MISAECRTGHAGARAGSRSDGRSFAAVEQSTHEGSDGRPTTGYFNRAFTFAFRNASHRSGFNLMFCSIECERR